VLLQLAGYEVLSAPNGYLGLQLFEEHNVNAVILDYSMPGMSGGIVAAKMKRSKPYIPIIMVSAHLELPRSTFQSIDAFVAKGEGPNVLLAELHRLLLAVQQGDQSFPKAVWSAAAGQGSANEALRRVSRSAVAMQRTAA
jgi:CheY-like chemotaxis protein